MHHDSYLETPARIDSPHGSALGVVCKPNRPPQADPVGVVFVPGGFQYKAGSHRQTVRMARQFAVLGVPSLRFDLTGLGDATGEMQGFEHLSPQILAASDWAAVCPWVGAQTRQRPFSTCAVQLVGSSCAWAT